MKESLIVSTRITVNRTALICSSNPMDHPVDTIWFVLHGYAQRAEEFLEMFRAEFRDDILFVAPEALSRFYRRNRDDYIGASWMTSAERGAEIEDYVAYLDSVFRLVTESQQRAHGKSGRGDSIPKICILGFSQGSSTASRWVYSGSMKPDRLVLWGGTPADELRSTKFQEKLAPCRVDWITGTEDKFTPPEKLHELLPQMDLSTNPIRVTVFEGKHELDPDTLAEAIRGCDDSKLTQYDSQRRGDSE